MARRGEDALATILLTTRLVESPAPPLSASDFWALVATVAKPGDLLADDDLGARLEPTALEADRVRSLLGRATAVAMEIERLESSGIRVITPFDDQYPQTMVDRLGPKAPAVLHVAGDASLLATDLLGIVGSRDVAEDGGDVAQDAARAAVGHGWGVVSGGARGVDRLATNAATDAGGGAVGLLADALIRVVQEPDVRRLVAAQQLCLATPFAPATRFTPANAMARNKLIYGLARRTFVVASDHEQGGTWSGATEALGQTLRLPVDVWVGTGAGPGNEPLAARGARAITDVEQIWDESAIEPREPDPDTTQLSMGV